MKRPYKLTFLAISLGVALMGYQVSQNYLPHVSTSESAASTEGVNSVSQPLEPKDFLTEEERIENQIQIALDSDPLSLLERGEKALAEQDYQTAYALFAAASDLKNATAVYKLASMLEIGAIGGEPDTERALELYQVAAQQGNTDAIMILALYYETGMLVTEDLTKATDYYRMAADKENYQALQWLMDRSRTEPTFATAKQVTQWNLSLAKHGDMNAMVDAGMAYYSGKGAELDKRRALQLFEDAAEAGDDSAHTMLASILLYDRDIERNPAQAVVWLRESAEDGNPRAQAMLGIVTSSLNDIASEGITFDDERAYEWVKKSMNQKYPLSYSYAGQMLLAATGTERDIPQAVAKFEEGARLGNADAMVNLAWQLVHGQGIEKDTARAYQLIKAAADQGYPNAIYNLGWLYEHGHGVKQDYAKAVEHYKAASKLKDPSGTYNLAEMYEFGRGTDADTEHALELYELAHRLGDTRAAEKITTLTKQG